MYNHVWCFERKLRLVPQLTSWGKYRTFWVAFVAWRVGLPQTAPNIGLHHSWRNRRKSFIFLKHSASYDILVPGRWKSLRCNHLRTLDRRSWKRNLNRSSATTCHVTSIVVYIAILWRWLHCLTDCICARGCSVAWSTVSVTPTWPSLLALTE